MNMSLYATLFYILAALIITSTALAVTRRNMVHAALYLVLSFFGSAMLFYLLGAPLLAALEIIIYAGAIMILFLFIIMMIRVEILAGVFFPRRQFIPAILIGTAFVAINAMLLSGFPAGRQPLAAAQALPVDFGHYLFRNRWLSVEIASLLLLVALVGAYLLGRKVRQSSDTTEETP
ncbi:MAG: NADH-quinone oxidoreductase subunit J [Desulfosarcinaceae bacterium]